MNNHCEYRGQNAPLVTYRTRCFSSFLVFHGGSGSTKQEIQTAVNNGVVKMNVDTGLYHFIDFLV
jgi:fructose/tagatose bisphosphate aldolase